jgi:hypothetical protein
VRGRERGERTSIPVNQKENFWKRELWTRPRGVKRTKGGSEEDQENESDRKEAER